MKSLIQLLVIVIFGYSLIYPQYQIKSKYILQPEKNIDFIKNEVNFFRKAIDTVHGGFYSNIDIEGNIGKEKKKSICSNSRLAYAFTRAFMVTGDTNYLNYAHHALSFVYNFGWDTSNGGWYFSTDSLGNLTPPYGPYWNPNEYKWSFQQHYALVGIGAMVEATGGNGFTYNNPVDNSIILTDMDWLKKGFDIINKNMWDKREEYLGYYSEMDIDWNNPHGKGFTPIVDGITTNALQLYLLNKNDFFKQRLLELSNQIVNNLVASITLPNVKFGFVESYDSDWNPDFNSKEGSIGHLCKTAWCLARTYLIEQNHIYKDAAKKILDEVLQKGGYDFSFGGIYSDYNWSSGDITKSKNYWMLEQAVTAGLTNYYLSDNETDKDNYLRMADESLEFFMNYFVDRINGGSFSETTVDGFLVNSTKGDMFKAGYHATEMGYFTYLYSNLFYLNHPVVLYYYYQPTDSLRNIKLSPLAIKDTDLKIESVQLNGEEFYNFNADRRTITINENTGGMFKVTFINSSPVNVKKKLLQLDKFILAQNYPNPFNPTTTIKYTIPFNINKQKFKFKPYNVTLIVYDILGRKVATLVDKQQKPGNYNVDFNGNKLSSGVYFYKLSVGKFTSVKKMLLTE